MGVETSFADMVGGLVNGRRTRVYRGRGGEFYCAGCGEREGTVAFPVRSLNIFVADDVCDRRKTIRGGGGGLFLVYIWAAVRTLLGMNGLTSDKARRASVYERKIVGFRQDQQDDWVAYLECGHTQHVRHNPPWMNRSWVMTDEGRQSRIGTALVCKKCEEMPDSGP